MKEQDRLPYESLSCEYIYTRMRNKLKRTEEPVVAASEDAPIIRSYLYTSKDAQEIISQEGILWRTIARVAFPLKKQIKRIPVIGAWAITVKEKFLNRAWMSKDLSPLLQLDINLFIRTCYQEMLEREVDAEAFSFYQEKLCSGMPKECLIYLLGRSPEFEKRFSILHLSRYQKRYRYYQVKNKLKHIPILSHILYLSVLPRTIGRINLEYSRTCANLREESLIHKRRIDSLHQGIWVLQKENSDYRVQIEDVREKLLTLEKRVLSLAEERSTYQSEVEVLQQELLGLKNVALDMKQEQKACQLEMRSFNEKIGGLYTKLQDFNLQIEALKQYSNSQQQAIAQISEGIDSQRQRIEADESALERCEKMLLALEGTQKVQGEQLSNVAENAGSLSTKMDGFGADLIQVKKNAMQYVEECLPEALVNNGILGHTSYLDHIGVSAKEKEPTTALFYEYAAELFRGDDNWLRKHMELYIPYIKKAVLNTGAKVFLDFGCGKGDFLAQLQENGIYAVGVDINAESAQAGIALGRNITIGDGLEYLQNQPADSLAGVSLFQVAEHMNFDTLFAIGKELGRTVAADGYVFIETLNAWCYGRFGNFHMDPSHVAFPSQDGLKLMLEMNGFTDVKVVYYAPIRQRAIQGEAIETSYEGFCVIGRKESE